MLLDRNDFNAPNQSTRFTSLVFDGKRAFLKKEEKTTYSHRLRWIRRFLTTCLGLSGRSSKKIKQW